MDSVVIRGYERTPPGIPLAGTAQWNADTTWGTPPSRIKTWMRFYCYDQRCCPPTQWPGFAARQGMVIRSCARHSSVMKCPGAYQIAIAGMPGFRFRITTF